MSKEVSEIRNADLFILTGCEKCQGNNLLFQLPLLFRMRVIQDWKIENHDRNGIPKPIYRHHPKGKNLGFFLKGIQVGGSEKKIPILTVIPVLQTYFPGRLSKKKKRNEGEIAEAKKLRGLYYYLKIEIFSRELLILTKPSKSKKSYI